jgi:hypothetical protein
MTAAALGMAFCIPAPAQEVSDTVRQTCRQFADANARVIVAAIRAKQDPGAAVRRVANSWLEGVQNHMLLAASNAEYLSEQELASIGYSYCVERRPTGK